MNYESTKSPWFNEGNSPSEPLVEVVVISKSEGRRYELLPGMYLKMRPEATSSSLAEATRLDVKKICSTNVGPSLVIGLDDEGSLILTETDGKLRMLLNSIFTIPDEHDDS